jgi:hypothetical protein
MFPWIILLSVLLFLNMSATGTLKREIDKKDTRIKELELQLLIYGSMNGGGNSFSKNGNKDIRIDELENILLMQNGGTAISGKSPAPAPAPKVAPGVPVSVTVPAPAPVVLPVVVTTPKEYEELPQVEKVSDISGSPKGGQRLRSMLR